MLKYYLLHYRLCTLETHPLQLPRINYPTIALKNQSATSKVARVAGPSNLQDDDEIDSEAALVAAQNEIEQLRAQLLKAQKTPTLRYQPWDMEEHIYIVVEQALRA